KGVHDRLRSPGRCGARIAAPTNQEAQTHIRPTRLCARRRISIAENRPQLAALRPAPPRKGLSFTTRLDSLRLKCAVRNPGYVVRAGRARVVRFVDKANPVLAQRG